MKIKAKKLKIPATAKVQETINLLLNCPESELAQYAKNLVSWPLQKSDLNHWVPVLNRFDSILANKDSNRLVVLAVLLITRLMWYFLLTLYL